MGVEYAPQGAEISPDIVRDPMKEYLVTEVFLSILLAFKQLRGNAQVDGIAHHNVTPG